MNRLTNKEKLLLDLYWDFFKELRITLVEECNLFETSVGFEYLAHDSVIFNPTLIKVYKRIVEIEKERRY